MQLRLTGKRWLERCTEITDVRVRIPECLKFFRLSFRNYVSKLRPWTAMIFFLRGSSIWYSYWYIHHFIFIFQFPDNGILRTNFMTNSRLTSSVGYTVASSGGQSSNLGKPEFFPAFFSQLHMTMISCSLHLFLYSVIQAYEVHIFIRKATVCQIKDLSIDDLLLRKWCVIIFDHAILLYDADRNITLRSSV